MGRFLCHVCYRDFEDRDVVRDGGKVTCRGCRGKQPAPPAAPSASPVPRPLAFQVKTKVLTLTMPGDEREFLSGKGTLTATPVNLQFKIKHMWTLEQELSVPWSRLRRVKNALAREGWFSADVGDDLVLKVTVDSGDLGALGRALDALPPDSRGEPCPACGTIVLEGACRSCGQTVASSHRRSGLWLTLGGLAVAGAGGALSFASYSAANPGNTFKIFTGVIACGVLMATLGLYKLLWGKTTMG